jgi:pimeloyl-ACP methyl ester carboxylesterase
MQELPSTSDGASQASPAAMQIAGTGPPLVYVPGMDGTGRLFYRQVPLLAPRFRVVTYALRDDAPHMEALVEDLDRVVRAVTAVDERAVLVGESFGGTLTLSYALAHPRRLRGIVVLNSFARFLPQAHLHLARAGIRMMPWGAMALVRRLTAFRMHSPHTHRREIRRFLSETRRTARRGYLDRLRMLTAYDLRDRLADIRVPALFLAADRDHLVPSVGQARYMADRVPGAALRILEGHGHVCLIAPGVDLGRIIEEWGGAG